MASRSSSAGVAAKAPLAAWTCFVRQSLAAQGANLWGVDGDHARPVIDSTVVRPVVSGHVLTRNCRPKKAEAANFSCFRRSDALINLARVVGGCGYVAWADAERSPRDHSLRRVRPSCWRRKAAWRRTPRSRLPGTGQEIDAMARVEDHRTMSSRELAEGDPRRPLSLPLPPSLIRVVFGAVPALVTVVFAGLITFLALFMDKQRHDYALRVADRFVLLAAVLVGTTPTRPR